MLNLRRSIHTLPKLRNDRTWSKNGVNSLFSLKGYNTAWKDYQTYLATKLTLLTQGTDLESKTAFKIMLSTHKLADKSAEFHYASQMYNNHFFWSSVVEDPENNTSIPNIELVKKINKSFGSFNDLKEKFLTKATELNGNGWIFLVETKEKDLQIKVLQNEGSPYFYNRNQEINIASPISLNDNEKLVEMKKDLDNNVEDWTLPLLGVSLWDHTVFVDYGVNRENYMQNVWKAIDWNSVNARLYRAS